MGLENYEREPTISLRGLPFRKNLHLARICSLKDIEMGIASYPEEYATPKYLLFMYEMKKAGWHVRLYKAGVSKYVFVVKEKLVYKVRFSNHKPLRSREEENDCDFYVGVSHKQVSTTEEILKKLL